MKIIDLIINTIKLFYYKEDIRCEIIKNNIQYYKKEYNSKAYKDKIYKKLNESKTRNKILNRGYL